MRKDEYIADLTATLYRRVMPDHLCPYGLKALYLLRREGFRVDDQPLRSRAEVDEFEQREGVATTPQVFIDDQRLGGYEALREYFGKSRETSYRPLLALFGIAALMATALCWAAFGTLHTVLLPKWFMAIAMCLLALLKLRDLESFSTMFLGYDLLARRWVPYAYAYPLGEGVVGLAMLSGIVYLVWLAIPIALFIGTVGAISVIKAVYLEHREMHCACMGGDSRVPLGPLSLIENLMMVGMALWMLSELM